MRHGSEMYRNIKVRSHMNSRTRKHLPDSVVAIAEVEDSVVAIAEVEAIGFFLRLTMAVSSVI